MLVPLLFESTFDIGAKCLDEGIFDENLKITFSGDAISVCIRIFSDLSAVDILVKTTEGSHFMLEMQSEDTLGQLKEQLDLYCSLEEESSLYEEDIRILGGKWPRSSSRLYVVESFERFLHPKKYPIPRYDKIDLTEEERATISYIVRTVADNSWMTLLRLSKNLNDAGDRVNHVHPFRFLEAIFTDEVNIVAARNIRQKGGLYWKNFVGGVVDSMTERPLKVIRAIISCFLR